MAKIQWNLFESLYWSPEKGKSYDLVLSNWRQETRSYDDGKTEKPVILFDVLKIDNEEYPAGKKLFATSAASFAEYARPIIERAEAEGREQVAVILTYDREKKYHVLDLLKVRGKTDGA